MSDEYNATVTANGEEALAALDGENMDIIINDILIPKMDGIEFLQNIRTNTLYSHLPIILLSAKTAVESKIEGLVIISKNLFRSNDSGLS